MLGYEPGSKAYRVLLDKTHSIVVSRDVIFDETGQPQQPDSLVPDPEDSDTDKDSNSDNGNSDTEDNTAQQGTEDAVQAAPQHRRYHCVTEGHQENGTRHT